MKKILIAVDYSMTAQEILETGNELAKAMNAQIILLHVVSDVTYYSSLNYSPIFGFDCFSSTEIVQTNMAERLRTASLKYLEKAKEHLNNPGIQTVVESGETSEVILSTASKLKADLIVTGTHSRGVVEKMFLGSITARVLQESVIPLFIIPVKADLKHNTSTVFQRDTIGRDAFTES